MSNATTGSRPSLSQSESTALTAAFFDVDGTIVSTHIVHQYLFVRKHLTRTHGGWFARVGHPIWMGMFFVRCAQYLYLDRVSRTRMNIAFYRNYAGLRADRVRDAAEQCFDRVLKPHLFGDAAGCVAEHLRAGRRVVLVTGSIDFLIEPLAEFLALAADSQTGIDLVARTLLERDGRFTGDLSGPPIGENEKAAEVRRYAEREKIDLAGSYAYGDSVADLPMLELVGFPNVVNPDRALARTARERDWPQLGWVASGAGA